MAITYTFGESFTKGLATGSTIRAQAEDQKLKAERLKEEIASRKERIELQQAMHTLQEKQFKAQMTGMVDGDKTWARQTYEQDKVADLSILTPFMTDEQKDAIEATGVDLKKIDVRAGGILGTILSANLGRTGRIQTLEEEYLPVNPWESPEGYEHDDLGYIGSEADWGLGVDQSEIADEARTYLTTLKEHAAVIKSIRGINPKSTAVSAYVKNLKALRTDLTDKDRFFHHNAGDWRRNFPANVKARKMGKEIDALLKFIGE